MATAIRARDAGDLRFIQLMDWLTLPIQTPALSQMLATVGQLPHLQNVVFGSLLIVNRRVDQLPYRSMLVDADPDGQLATKHVRNGFVRPNALRAAAGEQAGVSHVRTKAADTH